MLAKARNQHYHRSHTRRRLLIRKGDWIAVSKIRHNPLFYRLRRLTNLRALHLATPRGDILKRLKDARRLTVLGMLFAAILVSLGCGGTKTQPKTASPATSSKKVNSGPSDFETKLNEEVDRMFAKELREYETELDAWTASKESREQEAKKAKADLRRQIAEMKDVRPNAPTFEQREWRSKDNKFEIEATLVDATYKSVTLQKPNGKAITVAKSELNKESRLYVNKAAPNFARFKAKLRDWEAKKEQLISELSSVDLRHPKPLPPTREQIAKDVRAKKRERQRREKQRQATVHQPNRARVTRAQFGDAWPLTVNSGEVECINKYIVVFHAPNGKTYGLNGISFGHGYPRIHPIWRDNPRIPGSKVNIGPLIQFGLSLGE